MMVVTMACGNNSADKTITIAQIEAFRCLILQMLPIADEYAVLIQIMDKLKFVYMALKRLLPLKTLTTL